VSKDWLKVLVETIEQDDEIGIVQSLVITEGVPAEYYKKNGTINLLGHNVVGFFDINDAGVGKIFQANGCSMIIRWKLVEQLGGLFPDEYFAYAEDTYLSFKVIFNGKKIMHNSRSIVHHKGNATTKEQVSSLMFFYRERNRLLNFILFFPGVFQLKYLPFLAFNFWVKFSLSLFSSNYSTKGLFRAYAWLVCNPKWIREHRHLLAGYQNVKPDEVLKFISGKVFNGDNLIEKIANTFSVFYCRLVGLKVFEVNKSV
jgi:GT2 family glycosyltransferase